MLLPGRNFDFHEALVTFDVPGIEGNCPIGIIDSLIGFLKIFRINECELLIRVCIFRVCLDCIFQHVNRLRKIILLYQQSRNARSELRLAGIDI